MALFNLKTAARMYLSILRNWKKKVCVSCTKDSASAMKFMMTAAVRLLAPSKYCNRWQEPFSKSRPLQGDFFYIRMKGCERLILGSLFVFARSTCRIACSITLPYSFVVLPGRIICSRGIFCRIEALPVGTFAALAAVLLVAFVISGRFLFTSRKNFAKNPKTDIGSAASGGR